MTNDNGAPSVAAAVRGSRVSLELEIDRLLERYELVMMGVYQGLSIAAELEKLEAEYVELRKRLRSIERADEIRDEVTLESVRQSVREWEPQS